ncbi:hypothetical protein Tco_1439695 [Tanacetum coccineum]
MTALEEVKEDMTDLSSRQRLDSEEFCMRHQDAHDERALVQAQVSIIRRERRYHRHMAMLAESKAMYAYQAWSHAMDCNRAKMAPKKTPITDAAIKELIAQGVADALATCSKSSAINGFDNSLPASRLLWSSHASV